MSGDTAKVTLRHLMTMSGGFNNEFPGGFVWEEYAKPGHSFVNVLLERRQEFEPGKVFWYSDVSAHLVAAVLAAALERADGDRPRTVLDYAREKLFDPLGISTRPAFSEALPDPFTTEFVTAGFGWGTDPNGIQLGGYGLRLTAPDMMKIGELYRRDGVWNGQQIVPAAWIHQCTSPSTFKTNSAAHPTTSTACSGGSSRSPSRLDTTHLGSAGNASSCCPKSASGDRLPDGRAVGSGEPTRRQRS